MSRTGLMIVLAAVAASCSDEPAPRCNGAEALCARRYHEVSYATTHNAMSREDDRQWVGPNQPWGITRQLDEGIRAMMLDTYSYEGGSWLCHGSCLYGRQPLVDGLAEIKAFLDGNPREVVTLILEAHATPDETEAAMRASGLFALLHTHAHGTPWPTLGELIDSRERVVVFTERDGGAKPWYHDLWLESWDTPYAATTKEELRCTGGRGTVGSDLFVVNHFLTAPTARRDLAEQVNIEPFLSDRVKRCSDENGHLANFVSVDFYDVGDVVAAVKRINGAP